MLSRKRWLGVNGFSWVMFAVVDLADEWWIDIICSYRWEMTPFHCGNNKRKIFLLFNVVTPISLLYVGEVSVTISNLWTSISTPPTLRRMSMRETFLILQAIPVTNLSLFRSYYEVHLRAMGATWSERKYALTLFIENVTKRFTSTILSNRQSFNAKNYIDDRVLSFWKCYISVVFHFGSILAAKVLITVLTFSRISPLNHSSLH